MPRNQTQPAKPASGVQNIPFVVVPKPSLGNSMKEGFGLGIGMSVARNIVDRVMGPAQQAPAQQAPAQQALTEFKKCMQKNDDYEVCRIHLE